MMKVMKDGSRASLAHFMTWQTKKKRPRVTVGQASSSQVGHPTGFNIDTAQRNAGKSWGNLFVHGVQTHSADLVYVPQGEMN